MLCINKRLSTKYATLLACISLLNGCATQNPALVALCSYPQSIVGGNADTAVVRTRMDECQAVNGTIIRHLGFQQDVEPRSGVECLVDANPDFLRQHGIGGPSVLLVADTRSCKAEGGEFLRFEVRSSRQKQATAGDPAAAILLLGVLNMARQVRAIEAAHKVSTEKEPRGKSGAPTKPDQPTEPPKLPGSGARPSP